MTIPEAPHSDETTGPGPTQPATAESPPQGDSAPESDGGGDANHDRPGREAAKYRTRLRDTESQRDALAGRVAGFQRAEAERIASEILSEGGDLFRLGDTAMADLLDEFGEICATEVRDRAAAIKATRPGLGRSQPAVDPTQGSGVGQRRTGGPGWSDLLGS